MQQRISGDWSPKDDRSYDRARTSIISFFMNEKIKLQAVVEHFWLLKKLDKTM